MKKRSISILLMVLLVFSFPSMTVFAAPEEVPEGDGYLVTFRCDDHAKVAVYTSQDYSKTPDVSSSALSLDSKTGLPTKSGEGQVNFRVYVDEGYTLTSASVTSGTYKNLKEPSETGQENTYRITKIASDLVVAISTTAAEESEITEFEGYEVKFTGSTHATVSVYPSQDYTKTPVVGTSALSVDGDTGIPTKSGEGQVNFRVDAEDGYMVTSVSVESGTYKNLKKPSETGQENTYRITKIASDLVVTVSTTAVPTGVPFFVGANSAAGLDGYITIDFKKSGSSYTGTLYLPGTADTELLKLYWSAGTELSIGDVAYESGSAPIPANGESLTYTVTAGGSTAKYTVNTVQGSAGVEGMFLNIDESMGTIAAMNGDRNHETECFGQVNFAGDTDFISMKGRGNTTWTDFNKKPYNFTVFKKDDYGKKKSVELIKGVEAKKWSILANAKDPTCLRNKVGYDIADELGIGLPSESIDVWMNGEYLGNYLLTPKNDYQAPDDGYMVEIDNKSDVDQFTLSGSPMFTVKEMAEGLTVNDVKNSVSKAWDALRRSNSDEYLQYFDLDSWAKMYLLNELYKDVDVSAGSIFFIKAAMEDDSKLMAGPVWDLDGTLGRVSQTYVGMDHTHEKDGSGWYIDAITGTAFFQLLGKHASFMTRVYEIYNENKAAFEGILNDLDRQSVLIEDSAEMNFVRWPQYMTNTEHFTISKDNLKYGSDAYAVIYKKTDNWAAFTYNLKEYITKRLAFFSDNISVTMPTGSIIGETSLPAGDTLTLAANATAGSYQWQSSADGKTWTNIKSATGKTYSAKATTAMNGLQIRCVVKNTGAAINTTRVAKVAPGAMNILEPVILAVSMESHEHSYHEIVTAPTCTEQGHTTYTCTCGDSYVDDYTDPLGHNFVDGKCTRCDEPDPEYIPECVSEKTVSLANGTFIFTLGGNRAGEFTFAQSGNGWTIRGGDGRYLAFANNAFAYSGSAFVWTYTNNAFTTSVASSSSSRWGSFGGWRSWGNTTTTYYLTYANGRFSTSTNAGGSNAGFITVVENLRHSFGNWTAKNGVHSRTCSVCGKTETGSCDYDEWTTKNGEHSRTCSICHIADSGKCSYTKWTTEDGIHSRTCTVCHAKETGECSYGAWTPDENGQHSRSCLVCGDKIYEDCDYGTDHICKVCRQIDPDLVYATAIFVTGSGASAAPASQKVISGEGKITKPDDPIRIGYIFDGWFANGSEYDFDSILDHDVTITAKWTECVEHEYEGGKCTKCGVEEPKPEPECVSEKTVSLANGTFIFTLGGNRAGEFTFAQSGNGWTIRGGDGRYLAFANNAFAYSGSAFVWTYTNNAFTTSVASSSSSRWGSFGGWRSWGNTTTTYYLTYANGRFSTSTNAGGSNAGFITVVENLRHSFGNWTAKNGVHSRTCSVCGKTETGSCDYDEWTTKNGEHSRTCSICHIADSGKCSYTKWTTEDGIHSRTCTVCHAKETGECSYGAWTHDENGQHSRSCLVCGDKIYEDCDYGTDHICKVCRQIDPDLVYATAIFVTGSGASAAPASQKVISGEGKITKPDDPIRIGYIFDGWFANGSEYDFDSILDHDVTITAKWTECTEHEYENGKCKKCGADEPKPEPECISEKTVSLANGTFIFTLGGNRIGEFTFAQSGNGWTIRAEDGKYLAFANNAFAYSDTPFVWTYSGNAFTTSSNSRGGFNWNSTTYYLTYANGRFSTSTRSSGSTAVFAALVENLKHSFGSWTAKNGIHTRTCSVCGKEETGNCNYDNWTTVNGVHSRTCSICHIVNSEKCSYDSWTPAENSKHVKTCLVCGEKVYEDCVFGADHHCNACKQIDPNLEYVTATFVTGEGASTAPAAQKVIKGEGKVTKPADPTRAGYIFEGWFTNGSEYDFNTILDHDVTIKAMWTKCAEQSDETFIRIFHLDAGRKYFSADQIKNLIDTLAQNKYTHLELGLGNDALRFLLDDMSVNVDGNLYTSDSITAGISSGNKAFYDDPNGNYLTEREMDDIISYAKEKNVGLIPLINTPGHMNAMIDAMISIGLTKPAYNDSARTIDVTNQDAVNFTLALVDKYIRYFAEKGVKTFNMGCDEYANDKYTSGSMGFGNLISNGKYGSFVSFVNKMAAQIKNADMTPMAFNDGIYFNNNKSSGTIDTDILIAYWTSGWTDYNVRSAANLSSDGFEIINANDGWYYVLGRMSGGYSLQSAKSAAEKTGAMSVSGSTSVTPIGSMMCVWCDTPSASYSVVEVNNLKNLIETQSANNTEYFTQVTENMWNIGQGQEEDPEQTFVTATFVTGSGASAAPAAQKVISGEGKIRKPDAPTKIGCIFDGWFVDDEPFDFTVALTSNVTITAHWTECTDHEYKDGKCIKCGTDEPKSEPECIYEKTVSLANGKFILTLGGNKAGEFTFAQSGSGWTIRAEDGKYLAFANNAFTYSDTPFVWTYSNNAFTTSTNSRGGFNWNSTTYYLTYANGRFSTSSRSNGSTAGFSTKATSNTHIYGNWTGNKNGTHSRICVNCGHVETSDCEYASNHICDKCGAYDLAAIKIEVSVSVTSQSSSNSWGGWGSWNRGSTTTTTYTAVITIRATGTTVDKVEYSTNNGASWVAGSTVTSNSRIGAFLIRVTDGNGTIHNYRFNGTTVIAQ